MDNFVSFKNFVTYSNLNFEEGNFEFIGE